MGVSGGTPTNPVKHVARRGQAPATGVTGRDTGTGGRRLGARLVPTACTRSDHPRGCILAMIVVVVGHVHPTNHAQEIHPGRSPIVIASSSAYIVGLFKGTQCRSIWAGYITERPEHQSLSSSCPPSVSRAEPAGDLLAGIVARPWSCVCILAGAALIELHKDCYLRPQRGLR